jgi:hypothetical protein
MTQLHRGPRGRLYINQLLIGITDNRHVILESTFPGTPLSQQPPQQILVQKWQGGLSRRGPDEYRGRPLTPRTLMPYKVNEPRRHKILRARDRIENWAEYDAALRGQPDGLGHARGDRGVGAGGDRAAGTAAGPRGPRH